MDKLQDRHTSINQIVSVELGYKKRKLNGQNNIHHIDFSSQNSLETPLIYGRNILHIIKRFQNMSRIYKTNMRSY